jgi:hypothetical protein
MTNIYCELLKSHTWFLCRTKTATYLPDVLVEKSLHSEVVCDKTLCPSLYLALYLIGCNGYLDYFVL